MFRVFWCLHVHASINLNISACVFACVYLCAHGSLRGMCVRVCVCVMSRKWEVVFPSCPNVIWSGEEDSEEFSFLPQSCLKHLLCARPQNPLG